MARGAAHAIKPASGLLRFTSPLMAGHAAGDRTYRDWCLSKNCLRATFPARLASVIAGKKTGACSQRVPFSGTINLPPPGAWRTCPELHDN